MLPQPFSDALQKIAPIGAFDQMRSQHKLLKATFTQSLVQENNTHDALIYSPRRS